MKYELINPSDRIFFDAENNKIAQFCSTYISTGYTYENTETGESGNMYIFGIDEDGILKEFGCDIKTFIKENAKEIQACFASFRYSSGRTSMNRIVDFAHSIKMKNFYQ